MRIYGSDITHISEAKKARQAKAEGAAKSRRASDVGQRETVVLKKSAAKLASTVAADAAAREARIEQLKAAVESGTYQVDLDQLADRFVDEELARAGGGQ